MTDGDASESTTVEAWAKAYILTTTLARKCEPVSPPTVWEHKPLPRDVRPVQRPQELRLQARASRTPKPNALSDPEARARLLHTFWFHELQAAELMCWALLQFCEAEREFRRGLLRIWRDEVRHMALYQAHIESLGYRLGDFPVRDWFWQRVPTCTNQTMFVALMGMGLEAANLEHAPRFAQWFRSAGDEAGAVLQERVLREEVLHVRFATHWFERWSKGQDFDDWVAALPRPLSPLMMRGKSINRQARREAGMSEEFIERLDAWSVERNVR